MGSLGEILAGYDGPQAGQEAFYKDLHRHPELSHQEHRTAERVAGKLQEHGCTVQTGIGGTGVVGVLADAYVLPARHVKLMSGHRDQWRGTLLPLFQPAEETGDGAQAMVDDGLLARIPAPDVALAQHLLSGMAGTVLTRSGPFMATEDR